MSTAKSWGKNFTLETRRDRSHQSLPTPLKLSTRQGGDPVPVRAKFLRPASGRWLVSRDRLHRLLDLGVTGRLTAVVAPAGYGKTSLVSDWVAANEAGCGWITVDSQSSNLQQFVIDLMETIQRLAPGVGSSTLSLLSSGPSPQPAYLASAMADDLAVLAAPLVIVLDEFQELTTTSTKEFFERLLSVKGLQLSFIICSRQYPALTVAALQAHGQYLHIDTPILAFTHDEVGMFFQVVHGHLPDPEVTDQWWTFSEGWIALLQLAALYQVTVGQTMPAPEVLHKAKESAAEYISNELLNHIPTSLHAFLLFVSIPEVISPELAAALIQGRLHGVQSRETLADLAARGLFLSRLDEDGSWYRFHPLFRQMLRAELLETCGQGQVNVLHIVAGNWFATDGKIDRALSHLLLGGDTLGAANLVVTKCQAALCQDHWLDLDGWIGQLPLEIVQSNLELTLAQGWIHQVRGYYSTLPPIIERATMLLDREVERGIRDPHPYRAEIELLRTYTVSAGGPSDQEVDLFLESAFDLLQGTGRFSELLMLPMHAKSMSTRHPDQAIANLERYIAEATAGSTDFDMRRRLWGRSGLVILSRHLGSVDRLYSQASHLLDGAESIGHQRLIAQAHTYVGANAFERNDLKEAIHHLRLAAENPVAGIYYYNLASCLLVEALDLTGDPDGADQLLEELQSRIALSPSANLELRLQRLSARLAIRRGESPPNLSSVVHSVMSQSNWSLQAIESFPIDFFEPMLETSSASQKDRMVATMYDLVEQARTNHLPGRAMQCDVAIAWLELRDGQAERAHHRLASALDQANRGGRVRTIIGVGSFVHDLLETHSGAGFGNVYVDFLIESIEHESRLRAEQVSSIPSPILDSDAIVQPDEPLTNREIDVLIRLGQRLSNKEIGDELSISHLTVKSHARSIYAKLDVSGRRQAIRRAHELGIIPM